MGCLRIIMVFRWGDDEMGGLSPSIVCTFGESRGDKGRVEVEIVGYLN